MTTGETPKGKTIPKGSKEFVRQQHDLFVSKSINRQQSSGAAKTQQRDVARQPDPFLRRQVEDAAVEVTTEHFTNEEYTVNSVERDNVGWDLEAVRNHGILRLEVKGLSGPDISVELTPNEYEKMNSEEYRDSYRLCVVTKALTDPTLGVFAWSDDTQQWEDEEGRPLEIKERIAARCRAGS